VVAGAGVALAGAGAATGPAGVVAAALATGAGVGAAAFALAAGAAAVVLPLSAVLAAVCAWATGAIEINPANAVNQKALLRRITTLSRLRIGKEVPTFPDTKKRRTNGAPSSSAASSSDAALPPSRIFTLLSAQLRARGDLPPRRKSATVQATRCCCGERRLGE
jgi:hypothetical protein